jgi:site-specific recombinase XerD
MLAEINQFVNWVRRRNPTARTWKDYGYDLRKFTALVGDVPPNAISAREVDRFVSHQVGQGFKPKTINRRLASLVSFYAYLSDEDPRLICPVLTHRHHLRERQALPRPVQEEDLRAFFAAIEAAIQTCQPEAIRDRAMFTLMLRCGLRIGEVATLQRTNLYLEEPHPRLLVLGKGLHERTVYLSRQAESMLRTYLAVRPSAASDFIFLSYQLDGLSTTAIHKRLMIYRSQAEVTLSAHRLRHTFANDLLNAEVPVTTIQRLLGHRWLETTQTYVQANDQQVREDYYTAIAKLEGWQ